MSDFKKVGAFWKSEMGGKKVLQGKVDLDLRGLELSKKGDVPSVMVTIWPNTEKKNPAGPDYSMTAKVSGLASASDGGRMGQKPTAQPAGFFDDDFPAAPKGREPGEDRDEDAVPW